METETHGCTGETMYPMNTLKYMIAKVTGAIESTPYFVKWIGTSIETGTWILPVVNPSSAPTHTRRNAFGTSSSAMTSGESDALEERQAEARSHRYDQEALGHRFRKCQHEGQVEQGSDEDDRQRHEETFWTGHGLPVYHSMDSAEEEDVAKCYHEKEAWNEEQDRREQGDAGHLGRGQQRAEGIDEQQTVAEPHVDRGQPPRGHASAAAGYERSRQESPARHGKHSEQSR